VSDNPEVAAIARLMDLAGRYGLEELEVEENGLKIRLTAPEPVATSSEEGGTVTTRAYVWPPSGWAEPAAGGGSGRPDTARAIEAPLTGTFYRTQSPDAPPLCEVGETVEESQTIGLIEAMKVFSEIPAGVAGKVVEIVAQNGKLVQHGDILMYIDPS
jgi:acetyl-CoA carboxylase biotin carboxyl carrier protein